MVGAENALACAHQCAMGNEPKCRSFNFIEDSAIIQNCELISRASEVVDDEALVRRSAVSYFEKIREGMGEKRGKWVVIADLKNMSDKVYKTKFVTTTASNK